jgi:hypothetical protein
MTAAKKYGEVILALNAGELDDVLDVLSQAVRERKRIAGMVTLATVKPGDKIELAGLRPSYLNGLTGTVTGTRNTRILVTLDQPGLAGKYANRGTLAVPAACIVRRVGV